MLEEDEAELLAPQKTGISQEIIREFYKAPPQKRAPCSVVRIAASLMTVIVFGLVYLTYYPYIHHYGSGSLKDNVFLLVFHVLLGLMLASYCQIVYTDPGTVPLRWQKAVERMSEDAEEEGKQFELYRRCRGSKLFKPPRSHYDSVTRRLVLNMDHFCPWTTNTIGFFNRKFFILFLVYTTLTCAWAALTLYPHSKFVASTSICTAFGSIVCVLHYVALVSSKLLGGSNGFGFARKGDKLVRVDQPPLTTSTKVGFMTLLAFIFDVVFAICLTCFAIAHIFMAMRNMTSIENGRNSRRYRLSTKVWTISYTSYFESLSGRWSEEWTHTSL